MDSANLIFVDIYCVVAHLLSPPVYPKSPARASQNSPASANCGQFHTYQSFSTTMKGDYAFTNTFLTVWRRDRNERFRLSGGFAAFASQPGTRFRNA